jgi:rhodanese-related sulfurtransferase
LTQTTLTPAELVSRLDSSTEFALVDVRREGDFATGHLFSAVNIPRSLIELKAPSLIPERGVPVVLCDAGDGSAEEAARVLADMGYGDVAVLRRGLYGWEEVGGRLFSGVNVPSKAFGEFVEHEADTPHVGPEELQRLRENGTDLAIFDSRPASEFAVMSIPGAVNCPGGELVYRFFENVPSPDTFVVVNCAGRTRSIMGAQSLRDAGVPNRVVALRDGTMGWHLAGFALDRGKSARVRVPGEAALQTAREAAAKVAQRAGVRRIGWDDWQVMAGDGKTSYLLDVRDPEEFSQVHAAGARSAPGGQLIQTLDGFVAVRGARLVLCDDDDVRAPMSAAWLRQMGWTDVFVVAGGLKGAPRIDSAAPVSVSPYAINPKDADALRAAGRAAVLDLGTSKEYRQAHIAGASFCERADLPRLIAATPPERLVLLSSSDGRLAEIAAARLGLDRLRAIRGGTAAWRAAGLPTESGGGNLPARPTDVFYRPYDLAEDADAAMREYLAWEVGLLDRLAGEPGLRFWCAAGIHR